MWDQYDASNHSNPALLRVEKFKYLLSYLTGPGKDAIDGIRLADDNQNCAIKIITSRFGRKDLLVDDHLDKLLTLELVHSSADVDKLRDLYDRVTFRINALEVVGIAPDHYSIILHRVLQRALPHDLGVLYRQGLKESQPDAVEVSAFPSARAQEAKAILNFFRVQAEIGEKGRADRTVPLTRRVQERHQTSHQRVNPPTEMTLGAQYPCSQLPRCYLCNACDHVLSNCTASMSPEAKRRRLQANRCWFRCDNGTISHGTADQPKVWYAATAHFGTSRLCVTSSALRKSSSLPGESQSNAAAKRQRARQLTR